MITYKSLICIPDRSARGKVTRNRKAPGGSNRSREAPSEQNLNNFTNFIATINPKIVQADKLRIHKQIINFQILFIQIVIKGGNPVVFKDMYACVYVFCGRPRLWPESGRTSIFATGKSR